MKFLLILESNLTEGYTSSIILTAGHCSDSKRPDQVSVRAGTNFAFQSDKGQKRYAEQLRPHENFQVGANGVQAYNDIGLIKLSKPFEMNSDVQAIDWGNVSLDHNAFMFGFGYTDDIDQTPADYLRTVNVSFIAEEKCKGMLANTMTKSVKESYELCAEKCACNGDSGSPLIQMVDGVPKIVGIASWLADDLYGCNTPPAVFLKVADFQDWLTEKLRDLEMDNTITGRPNGEENKDGTSDLTKANHRSHGQYIFNIGK